MRTEQPLARLRVGEPIIVVSGLPRSGTSMAMKMLDAGGVPTLTDGVRTADLGGHAGTSDFTDDVIRRTRQKLEVWSAL